MRDDLSSGVPPYSTRVMNLSHLLTESARRLGAAVGFVWGATHGHGPKWTRAPVPLPMRWPMTTA